MKNEKINSQIIALWNKYFQNDTKVYAPLFYDDFKQGGLLFVGMNPSFSARGFKSILKGTEYEKIDPVSFFKWSNISRKPDLINDCINIEQYAGKNYPSYFGRPDEIAKEVGLAWQHIDLFLYKETNQSDFKKRVVNDGALNQFALDQLAIFDEVLMLNAPVCIVVINALASELIRSYAGSHLEWDEKRGFHWFKKGNMRVPIFFSSMLSGQRALDRWSYERLKWHIGEAVKNN